MKNSVPTILLISFTVAAGVMTAQTADQTPAPIQTAVQSHHVMTPEAQLKHLTNKLALTSDQQNQILPLLTDRAKQVSVIQADNTLSKKERHAKLLAARNDSQSRIRNVLTDTQRTAYDAMQQEQRERARTKKLGSVSN